MRLFLPLSPSSKNTPKSGKFSFAIYYLLRPLDPIVFIIISFAFAYHSGLVGFTWIGRDFRFACCCI